ncbi:unnamed protein product [Leuciscus chuanchicus]
MAVIKEEREDVKIEEVFSVKQEENEEQTDLMALKEESQEFNENDEKDRSLHDLNQRLKLARKSKKLLWEDITGELSHHFKQTFVQDKVTSKWNTLVGAYKKVKDNNSSTGRGPSTFFFFFAEMDDLLGSHHDIVFPIVGITTGLDVRRPDALQVYMSAPDISLAQSTSAPSPVRLTNSPSPAPSSPPSPPLSSCVPHPTVTTILPDTPRRPRKHQREDELLAYLKPFSQSKLP